MRIATRLHGILDYTFGALLIAAPWLLGIPRGGPASSILIGVGAVSLLYSVFTDYELGLVRRIQMPVHLWLDGLAGVFLALSPWLFAFDDVVRIPHLVAGILVILVAFFTNTIPGYDRRGPRRPPAG